MILKQPLTTNIPHPYKRILICMLPCINHSLPRGQEPAMRSKITQTCHTTKLTKYQTHHNAIKRNIPTIWNSYTLHPLFSLLKSHSYQSHLSPFSLSLSPIHPPPTFSHFHRAHPPARANNTSIHFHSIGHCVVGPCINGHLFTLGYRPRVLLLPVPTSMWWLISNIFIFVILTQLWFCISSHLSNMSPSFVTSLDFLFLEIWHLKKYNYHLENNVELLWSIPWYSTSYWVVA
jgi:hypothetical protein